MSVHGIMLGAIALIALIFGVAACTSSPPPEPIIKTVPVELPVYVMRTPPTELLATSVPSNVLPFFVMPGDKTATSCVTPNGEKKIRALLINREKHLQSLEVWATQK